MNGQCTIYLTQPNAVLKNLIYLFLSFVLVVSASVGRAQCVQNVDFNTWVRTGDSSFVGSNGWQVLAGGTELLSQQNTNFPRMFVGPDTLINVRVTGTFRVEDNSDDDYIGFVFGFKETWDQAWYGTQFMYHEYNLFDWKKTWQNYLGYIAQEGFSLDQVDGNFQRTNASAFPSFWVHTNSPAFSVLQTDFGVGTGWVAWTYYDFELLYTPTRAVILIDNDTIFDESRCFEPGLFGFYNYSQQGARYLNFNYELYIDYQIESYFVCLGDTARFNFTDTGGCAGLTAFSNLDTFYWDLGDGTITNDTNPRHVYQTADTFLVSLIATDINGCTDTSQKEVYIQEAPEAEIFAPTTCQGSPVNFVDTTFIAVGNAVAWDWDFGDGSGSSALQNPTYTYNQAGTYTVQLIVETNAGCKDTADTQIVILPLPDVDFQFENACDGDAVQFVDNSTQATAPITSYEWDVQNDGIYDYNASNATHIYANFGFYATRLRVEDAVGCRDSTTKTIEVHPIPDANFFADGECLNDVTIFQDSSMIDQGSIQQWFWEFGDGNDYAYAGNNPPSPGPAHTYASAGVKTVNLLIVSDSGCADSVEKNIQVYHLPVANFNATTACDNELTQFAQSATSQSGTINLYRWQFGDGDSAFSPNVQHNYPIPGLYKVIFGVETNLGCKDTVQKSVRVFPSPIPAFAWKNNVCEGEQLPFYDQSVIPQVTPGGDSIVQWLWVFNGIDSLSEQSPVFEETDDQNIAVELTVWSNEGCHNSIENTATIFPLPNADFEVNVACVNDSTSFKNTSTVKTGLVDQTFWDFGDGNFSTKEHPHNTYLTHGNKVVSLRVVSNKGCEDNVSKPVMIPETPVADFTFTPENGCSPLTLNVTNESNISLGELDYRWWIDDSLVSEMEIPDITIVNDTLIPTFHSIKLMVESEQGCSHMKRMNDAIAVLPAPIAGLKVRSGALDMIDPLVVFTNTSEQGVRWLWDFGDESQSNDFAPAHTYSNSGNYEVFQVAWNEFSCPDTAFLKIEVEPFTTMYIPSAFTPNGDGDNETWFIRGFNEGKQFQIEIFNRWGERMYQSKDMQFEWDGSMPGSAKPAPIGAYVYRIVFRTSDDKEREVTGTFNLVR